MVVAVDVPPLRRRIEDLPAIAEYLRLRHSAYLSVTDSPFSRQQLVRMMAYQWPGNIRELENFVCRYILLGGDRCTLEELGTTREFGAAIGSDDAEIPHT